MAVALLFTLAVLAGICVPAFVGARERAQDIQNINTARQISLACIMYADDHAQQLPDTLERLVEFGYVNDELLNGPNGTDGPGCEFELVLEGRCDLIPAPSETIMILSKDGRVVAFADGHTEVLTSNDRSFPVIEEIDELE